MSRRSSLTVPVAPAAAGGDGDLRLPREPGAFARFWSRHPRLTDWLIALFWGLPAVMSTLGSLVAENDSGPRGLKALVGVLIMVVACSGVFVRRRHPLAALLLLSAALLVMPFVEVSLGALLPVFGVYAVAVYRSNLAAWIGAAALEAGSVCYGLLLRPFGTDYGMQSSAFTWATSFGLLLVVGLLIGVTVGNRRRYLAALIGRAAQLARERDQQAALAAAAERARIAREMHDVVSHSLTVMIALAEGSAAAAAVPESASQAAAVMRQVADTGRDALGEMRRMLGVLGGDGQDVALAPQPTLAQLPELIERFRSLGLPVALEQLGEPSEDAVVQLTVYRVVQEALTNALRYAHGPTQVRVRVDAEEEPLVVAVEDDGLPGIPTPSVGAGRGLVGLRERVTALQGVFESGPRTEPGSHGGWRVVAVLPASGTVEPGREDA